MMCGGKDRGGANDQGGRRARKAAQKLGSRQMSGHRELLCFDLERPAGAGVPFAPHHPHRTVSPDGKSVLIDLRRSAASGASKVALKGCGEKLISLSLSKSSGISNLHSQNFIFRFSELRAYVCRSRAHKEGRFAIVTNVGAGCDGRVGSRETNAADADGKAVWSCPPDAGDKLVDNFTSDGG
jgi:hypothetical protein